MLLGGEHADVFTKIETESKLVNGCVALVNLAHRRARPQPVRKRRLAGFGLRRPTFVNPGRSLAGTVAAVGAGGSGFSVGDEVFGIGDGTFAQYAAARADKIQTPAHVAQMNEEFRKNVLDYEGPDALSKCKQYTTALVVIGDGTASRPRRRRARRR